MRKSKTLKKTEKKDLTIDILCNLCGESCVLANNGGHYDRKKNVFVRKHDPEANVYGGLIELVLSGGYDSTHFDDMTSYRFSLCEKCLRGLMDKFSIPVEIKSDYTPGFISETDKKKHLDIHSKAMDKYEKKCLKKMNDLKKKNSLKV